MTITIRLDDGQKIVYSDCSDIYVAMRYTKLVVDPDTGKKVSVIDTSSASWASNLRELTKELTQSLIEIQDVLKQQRGKEQEDGNPS